MWSQEIPPSLKNKIIQIWENFIGSYYHRAPFTYAYFPEPFISSGEASPQNLVWKNFHDTFNQAPPADKDFFQWCCHYLLKNSTEKIIPLIEITFNYMAATDQEAIQKLNDLFKEHGTPYVFAEGKVGLSDPIVPNGA